MTTIRPHLQEPDRSRCFRLTAAGLGLTASLKTRRQIRAAAVTTALCVAIVSGGTLLTAPAEAAGIAHISTASVTAGKRPAQFASVTAHAGPGVGEVTFTWKHDGKNTTGYRLETALSMFSKTSTSLPSKGRHDTIFNISPHVRSYTLTAARAAKAGAPIGSGNNLFFRFYAINTAGPGTQVHAWPYLQGVMPEGAAPQSTGMSIRLASFNVRTAKAVGDNRDWLTRRVDVANEIKKYQPQVVTMQELGPGRADGKGGSTAGTIRQTDSLEQSLKAVGAENYKLVRTTPYVEPGKESGTQGARILYDSDRLTLLSLCPETTGTRSYSSSCSIKMPLLPGDSESLRRRAAYAKFRNNATGVQFYVVSAHLDTRHGSKSTARSSAETADNGLRGDQVSTVLSAMDAINTGNLPVVFAGDMNSWQNILTGNAPHDTLVKDGFFDTASAPSTANLKYSTFNNFETTQKAAGQGYGPRLDLIMVKGGNGASSFTNVTNVTDSSRPSDHNMIVADAVL